MCNKTIQSILFIVTAAAMSAACHSEAPSREGLIYIGNGDEPLLKELRFVKVPASVFTFNEAPSGFPIDGSEKLFEAAEPSFWITSAPVPRDFLDKFIPRKSSPKGLSYDDIESILDKIYESTGLPVVLPTESMYEAALQSEAIRPHQRTEVILSDRWQASVKPNYNELTVSYRSAGPGEQVVLRSPYSRLPIETYRRRAANAFYLAMRTGEEMPAELVDLMDYRIAGSGSADDDGKRLSFDIDGVPFNLLPVKGGTLTLGATPEQERYAEADEKPAREVTLDPFKLGETEVTIAQWKAVMGAIPSGNNPQYPDMAVTNVSWFDCQEFVLKLRALTGLPIRLPSEDEWEYAARGGRLSHGYVFAGSNNARDVAVCTSKSTKRRHKDENERPALANVSSRKPNELGLYDMSGNAWEWVRGAHNDGSAVLRGGSRLSTNIACRVSNRQPMAPGEKKDSFGLRIAL